MKSPAQLKDLWPSGGKGCILLLGSPLMLIRQLTLCPMTPWGLRFHVMGAHPSDLASQVLCFPLYAASTQVPQPGMLAPACSWLWSLCLLGATILPSTSDTSQAEVACIVCIRAWPHPQFGCMLELLVLCITPALDQAASDPLQLLPGHPCQPATSRPWLPRPAGSPQPCHPASPALQSREPLRQEDSLHHSPCLQHMHSKPEGVKLPWPASTEGRRRIFWPPASHIFRSSDQKYYVNFS